jgi:nitrite reductase/ring-hydroxylating ferredoxin subunit
VAQESSREIRATRRAVLAGAGLAGVAALAACGRSGSGSAAAGAPSGGTAAGAKASGGATSGVGGALGGAGGTAAGGGAAGGGSGGTVLASTSAIPMGGGKVFAAEKVVVTQPSAGQFNGFSAVCTHEQCIVDQVADGTIDCPCHGSRFSITDGSVVAGPAPRPLPTQKIGVADEKITLS